MNDIVIFCASFSRDIERVKILAESIYKYNEDKIPFYISVPSDNVQLFKNKLGTVGYHLITDEEVVGEKLTQSWHTQQIIKTNFWKLKLCYNYTSIDSDGYFIKPFKIKDFIVDENTHTPYTIMHEQKDLFSWTTKNKNILGFDPQESFASHILPAQDVFGRSGGRLYDFGPLPIYSAAVWKALDDNYLLPNGLTIKNLLYTQILNEFDWYGESLLAFKPIELWPIEPIFKMFHYLQQYYDYKQQGYTEEHWSKNYLGICMQSSSNLPLKY